MSRACAGIDGEAPHLGGATGVSNRPRQLTTCRTDNLSDHRSE